jgi:hypothetical protein
LPHRIDDLETASFEANLKLAARKQGNPNFAAATP